MRTFADGHIESSPLLTNAGIGEHMKTSFQISIVFSGFF